MWLHVLFQQHLKTQKKMKWEDKGKKPQQILKADSMMTWLEMVYLEASVGGAVSNWSLLIVLMTKHILHWQSPDLIHDQFST